MASRAWVCARVIYSGWGMWESVQGSNHRSFADLPMWDTNVTGTVDSSTWVADMNVPVPVPFGGWNTPSNPRVMVQQAFNVTLERRGRRLELGRGGIPSVRDIRAVDPPYRGGS